MAEFLYVLRIGRVNSFFVIQRNLRIIHSLNYGTYCLFGMKKKILDFVGHGRLVGKVLRRRIFSLPIVEAKSGFSGQEKQYPF